MSTPPALGVGLLALLALLPTGARGQALLREYVARVTHGGPAPPASALRGLEARAVDEVQRRAHCSERFKVEPLAAGRLLAVYTRSQLRPGSLDRFTLFAVEGGRIRELAPAEAYRAVVRGLPYATVVDRWRRTVGEICTTAYQRGARVRVQVETELRFLEPLIAERGRRSTSALPWQAGWDAGSALSRIGAGGRMRSVLARTAVGENTLQMLGRGDYGLHTIRATPRAEFAQLLRWARHDPGGYPYLDDATREDWPNLARRNSRLARLIAEDIDGVQFARQRSASIAEGLGPTAGAGIVAHELNHGANRIAAKDRYGKRETLAFELTAAAAARRALGQPLDGRALRRLKREIIERYELGSLAVDSVADRPHGQLDNWVPRFPQGEEQRYLERYFAQRQ